MAKRLVPASLMVCVLLFQGQPSRIGSGVAVPGVSDAVAAGRTARFSTKAVSGAAHSAGQALTASTPGTNPNAPASPSTVSSTSSNTALAPFYSVTGQVSDSIDGVGTLADSGTVRVQKPAGATVRAAFLLSASTGFTSYQIPNGDVQLDGTPVSWNTSIVNSIQSYNYLADVTSIVQPVVDAAAPGTVTFTVSENDTADIDGEILAVVFNDPSQPANNAVSLLFGAQNVNGDTFNLAYTTPISTTDPNFRAIMSLGISYGYQAGGTQQYSIVNVNGQRMTTSAGGEDDWQGPADGDGALLTVGGIGDSTSNPPDPYATPTNPRSDDELYDLTPFMKDGDTSVSVFTQNPSNDDNIFLAAFLTNPPESVGCNALAAPTGGSVSKQAAVTAQDLSARTADLADQDTETEHDTQQYPSASEPNPPIDVQLFNAPVAFPNPIGWNPRDTLLVPSGGPSTVSTADTPFTATVSLMANDPSLVSLTNEEDVPLAIGVSTIDGTPPAAVTGTVMADSVTYPAVTACESLTVHATVSGADLGIVADGAGIQGAASLSLTADPTVSYTQDATGAITVTDTITQTAMNGNDYADPEEMYFIEQPVATDSSLDPGGLAATGPITMTLGAGSAGQQTITLQVDPTWLQDPRRVFPVHIDLPIVTADSARLSGVAGTLNSCRPGTPAPQTDTVVGSEGSCAYHGLEYFDTSSIPSDATIISATLHLYTLDSTGMTGIMVYPNDQSPGDDPLFAWLPPTWNSAPPIAAGASGIAQTTSDGNWQSWDITSIVQEQGWAADPTTNNGLTLTSTGAPIRIASALGAGSGTPDTAPYLSIVNSPAATNMPSASPQTQEALPAAQASSTLQDGASTIYGVSGTFNPDITASGDTFQAPNCPQPGDPALPGCNNALNVKMITGNLGGQYMRFRLTLDCPSDPTGLSAWWNNPDAVKSNPYDSTIPNDGTVWDLLTSAHATSPKIIPIVDLLPNAECPLALAPDQWYAQASDFAQEFVNKNLANWEPGSDWIDFEVGNEENTRQKVSADQCTQADNCYHWNDNQCSGGVCYTADLFDTEFPADFAEAVQGLADGLSGYYAHYRVMPGGVLNPTADPGCSFKLDVSPSEQNIFLVQQAIYAAENVDPNHPNDPNVRAHLAVALHPYQYGTPAFVNFAHYLPKVVHGDFTNSVCHRLDKMLSLWKTGYSVPSLWPQDLRRWGGLKFATLQGLPIFFTEVDWTGNQRGTSVVQDRNPNNKGSYLTDLFTWLNDSPYHAGTASQSPLRVLWFDAGNFDDTVAGSGILGIYDAHTDVNRNPGGELPVTILNCIRQVRGMHNMSHDFLTMRNAACW